MIPDIFPAIGLVDDVSVLAWAAKQVVDEIDKYKNETALNNAKEHVNISIEHQ